MEKRKSRFLQAAGVAVALSLLAAMPVFAGKWKMDEHGKWYWYGECHVRDGWRWLDGNNDGIYECYYFDGDAYLRLNTTTPDGYRVDENGAWVVNGVVQTKTLSDELAFIRKTYAYTNAHIDEYQAQRKPADWNIGNTYNTEGNNIFYYTQSGTLVKQLARFDDMTVEIYHLNPDLGRTACTWDTYPETTVVFAFAYDKYGNEYRVYLKDAEVIRCIGPDKVTWDFPRGLIFGEFESSSVFPNPKLQSYIYKDEIERILRIISPSWYISYEFNEDDGMENFVW